MSGAGRQVAPLSQFPQWPCHRHPFNPAQWSEISPSTWKSPLNVGWQTTKAPLFDINILFISWQKQLQALPCSHDWLVKISCLKSVQIGTYLLLAWNSLWCTAWAAFAFLSFEFSHNPEFVFPSSFPICVTKCFVIIIVVTTSQGSRQNTNLAYPGLASRGSRPQPEQQCPPHTWLGDPGCLCKRD